MNESKLVCDIMTELGKYGYVVRCNSGSIPMSNGKRFRAMPQGFSDIMLILPGGKACFVECKTGNNKASPEQRAFIERMRKLGARAGIAYSVAEAAEICEIIRG